jgi:hypothetical protein
LLAPPGHARMGCLFHSPTSLVAALQEPHQGQRAVVFLVPRRVDQGDGALLALLLQQPDGLLFLCPFFPVTLLELVSLGRVMAEPFTQLRARGYLLQPQVHGSAFLAHAARPQSVHQDSRQTCIILLLLSGALCR